MIPTATADASTTAQKAPATKPDGRQTAEKVARSFIVGWTTFIPWDFDPAEDWFDRWEQWATPEFIGQMQTSVGQRWAWTWNEQKKAFDTRVENVDGTWLNADRTTAVARVTVSRLVLGMLQGADESETQTLTYDVWMSVDNGTPPLVFAVHQTAPDAPAPAGANE
ncbi:MAG: hypothetical protein L0H59_00125 [Tomitella sp.]|nr:hypothetical protein [Tomitella sp.]